MSDKLTGIISKIGKGIIIVEDPQAVWDLLEKLQKEIDRLKEFEYRIEEIERLAKRYRENRDKDFKNLTAKLDRVREMLPKPGGVVRCKDPFNCDAVKTIQNICKALAELKESDQTKPLPRPEHLMFNCDCPLCDPDGENG